MSTISFYIGTQKLIEELEKYRRRNPELVLNAGSAVASRLEQIAKKNAPWTDRTGMARRTMEGIQGFQDKDNYYIGIQGNMPYSIRLERWYNRRYAILVPTMREQSPYILDEIRDIISMIEES